MVYDKLWKPCAGDRSILGEVAAVYGKYMK